MVLNFDGRGISLGRGHKFSGYKEGSGSPGGASDKESPANTEDIRDAGLIPELGGGDGNLLHGAEVSGGLQSIGSQRVRHD